MIKKCTRCKQDKDVSEFYTDNRRKDGLRSLCSQCMLDQLAMRRREKGIPKMGSEEYYRQCSEVATRIMSNPEIRRKLSERNKISVSKLWEDPEYRRNHTEKVKLHWENTEEREKASIRQKKFWDEHPECREINKIFTEKLWEDTDYKQRMCNGHKNRWEDPEQHHKMSVAMTGRKMPSVTYHHVKYLEIHGYDEYYAVPTSEHRAMHARYRREGICNIPGNELRKISAKAVARRLGRRTYVDELPPAIGADQHYVCNIEDIYTDKMELIP